LEDKGAVEDSGYKILDVFDWKVKKVEAVGTLGGIGGNIRHRTWWKSKMTDSRSFRSALQTK